MGTTRTELAIDDSEPLGDEPEGCCDDIRLAWIVRQAGEEGGSGDFDALWIDR